MTRAQVVVDTGDGIGEELVTSFQRLGAAVAVQREPSDAASTAPEPVVSAASGPALDGEALRRLAADDLGLPTAPFWFASSVAELVAIVEHAGFPLVVKPVGALAGEGRSVLLRGEDVAPAWQRAVPQDAGGRVLVETVVEVDYEITVLTIRGAGGALSFCEPIGHRQADGSLEAWQPQQMSQIAVDSARSIAARVVNALGGRGVFGVELLVRGDEVYFADVTGRLPDAGLVTLRSQRLSMFDLHARATLGLPVDGIMVSPGAVEVFRYRSADQRDDTGIPEKALAAALAVPESDVRVFTGAGARRDVGVALATGPDVTTARDRVRRMSVALRSWWS